MTGRKQADAWRNLETALVFFLMVMALLTN